MSEHEKFRNECGAEIDTQETDSVLQKLAGEWLVAANTRHTYLRHHEWLKRQQDVTVIQETNFAPSLTPPSKQVLPMAACE